jgi:hypothetical protein
LTPKLRGYNPEAALNSLESQGKPSRPFRPLEGMLSYRTLLSFRYANRDLDKPTFDYFGHVTPPYPDMAMLGSKDTRRNPSKLQRHRLP